MKAECPDCPPAHHFFQLDFFFLHSLPSLQPFFEKLPMLVHKRKAHLAFTVKLKKKGLSVKSSAAAKTDFT